MIYRQIKFIHNILQTTLFKAFSIYTISSMLNAALQFLLLPILTRYLSPEDYGIVAMYNLLFSVTSVFIGLSVHGSINRAYFDNKISNYKEFIWNCLIILFLTSIFIFLFYFLTRSYISSLFSIPPFIIWTLPILGFFQFVILSLLSIYQATQQAFKYAKIQIGQLILMFLLTIIFVMVLHLKWEGRILAQIFGISLAGIVSFLILNKFYTEKKLNTQYILYALKFGIPLIPHVIGGMLISYSDRFIINIVIGVKAVGIYTVGYQIGMVLTIITESFNKAFAPWLFNKLNENNPMIKNKIVSFTYSYFFVIILLAVLFFYLFKSFFHLLIGDKFKDADQVIFWILLGNAFGGMYFMVVNYIFYVNKTFFLAVITFLSGITNIPVTYLLTKLNGVVGAAQSYTFINFFTFILTWYLSNKLYPMPWFKAVKNNFRGSIE